MIPITLYRQLLDEWIEDGRAAEVENLSPAWLDAVDALRPITKHMGPGNHPSGSPQEVHGSGEPGFLPSSQHGSQLLGPQRGERERSANKVKRKVVTYLTLEDGSFPPVGSDSLPHLYETVIDEAEDGPSGPIQSAPAEGADTIIQRLREKMDSYGWTPKTFDKNLNLIWESAKARYAAHPELIDEDKFYERWHNILSRAAAEADLSLGQVVAASSVISPGYEAEANLQATLEMIKFYHEDRAFTGKEKIWTGKGKNRRELTLQKAYREAADLIRNPVAGEKSQGVLRREINPATGNPFKVGDALAPETSAIRLAVADQLDAAADLFDKGPVRISDLGSQAAARLMHYQRQIDMGAGFQTKNYSFLARGVEVLRGKDDFGNLVTANDVLTGIKTRSFYNNIVDPYDSSGRDDVTIDFHTVNMAGFARGADANTDLISMGIGGVQFGVRPFVADSIRRIAKKNKMSSARVQEILWAEWKRGGTDPRSGKDAWIAFSGEEYLLPYLGKGRVKKVEP